ncbi:MAG: antibiotic biosynthesis monooxygenase family protein [Bdellovibrionota bacterium]
MRISIRAMPTPKPPYFAVIFTSELTASDASGYEPTATRMAELARQQPGFVGFDSARGNDRLGITVSYWSSLESIRAWKAVAEHREAQARGRREWYPQYRVRVAEVKEEYGFG